MTLSIITDKELLSGRCGEADQSSCTSELNLIREAYSWVKNSENRAVGLAAPQVGSKRAWFVMRNPSEVGWFDEVNPGGPYLIIVNPKIKKLLGRPEKREEACFSLPGEGFTVLRHTELEASYQLLDPESGLLSKVRRSKFTGRSAQIFQHEYHHTIGLMVSDVGVAHA